MTEAAVFEASLPPYRQQKIVEAAREWIGTPYHHQASRKGVGCDCLGLVRGVYREIMGREPETPPPYSRAWAESRGEETLMLAAERHLHRIDHALRAPGDIVIFRFKPLSPAKHMGVLTGDDFMVHAIENNRVAEIHLSLWWQRRIAGIFRFPQHGYESLQT